MDKGRICPKCDRAVSPKHDTCPKCEPATFTGTFTWPVTIPNVAPYYPYPLNPPFNPFIWC